MKKPLKAYLPGHAQDRIENAHAMIIELRKTKTELLSENPMTASYSLIGKGQEILIVDEKIKQWEEVIKLWSGKLDPSRNKLLWSIIVPILVSVVVSLLVFKLRV